MEKFPFLAVLTIKLVQIQSFLIKLVQVLHLRMEEIPSHQRRG